MNKLNAENFLTVFAFVDHCLDSIHKHFLPELFSVEYEIRFGRIKMNVFVKFQGSFKDEIKNDFYSLPCKMRFSTLITKDNKDSDKFPCSVVLDEIGDVKTSHMSDQVRHQSLMNMSNPFKDQKGGVSHETEEKETQSSKLL